MAPATDTDIREIKTALEANTRSIEALSQTTATIVKATESPGEYPSLLWLRFSNGRGYGDRSHFTKPKADRTVYE